jgi:hypothetical protein
MLEAHPTVLAPLQSISPRPSASSSIIDGLGTRSEEGVVATDFQLDYDSMNSFINGYKIKINNKHPVAVSNIDILIVFYSEGGKMLDFKRMRYEDVIPAGLTKNIWNQFLGVDTERALIETWTWNNPKHHDIGHYTFKTELRVIGFRSGGSQY